MEEEKKETLKLNSKIVGKLGQIEISYKKDSLTWLWNQTYIAEQVNEYMAREKGGGIFFLIDIDDFTKINEEFGHIMGDAYLVKLAAILKSSFRNRDSIARLSGDEFAVFIAGSLSYKDIDHIAEKLIRSAREGFINMKLGSKRSISIGISRSPGNGSDFLSLYKKANEALELVKKAGKNGYRIAEETAAPVKDVNTEADVRTVKNLITERNEPAGAFYVDYDGFKDVYQFITRYADRQEMTAEILLFTVTKKDGKLIEPMTLSEAMFDLENIIKVSLRIGDVATRYSTCQYLVMLTGTESKNVERIGERVIENYQKFAEKYGVVIKCDRAEF